MVINTIAEYTKADRTRKLPQVITWGQEYPFNKYTPHMQVYSRFTGRYYDTETPSGCVATAISTVMRWHQYPNKPKGKTDRYFWQKAGKYIESIDFDADPNNGYNWANMPAGIDHWGVDRQTKRDVTELQADNIGRLLRDVGYAIHMNYGPSASGTFLNMCVAPLVNNFGYSSNLRYIERKNFATASKWWKEVTDELQNYGPIVYAGISRGGGHCFVLDGYANDPDNRYVHVDWGWNYMENGWYKLDILEPDTQGTGGGIGSFDKSQQMLRYLAPENAPGPAPQPIPDNTEADAKALVIAPVDAKLEKADNQSLTLNVKNSNIHSTYKGKLAIFLLDKKYELKESTEENCHMFAQANVNVAPNGTQNVKFTGNLSAFTPSTYRAILAYQGKEDWVAFNEVGFVAIANTVNPTPTPNPEPAPIGNDYKLSLAAGDNVVAQKGKEAKVTIVVKNTGTTAYSGKMKLAYAYSSNPTFFPDCFVISESASTEIVKVPANSQATVTFYCNNANFTSMFTGDYTLVAGFESKNGFEPLRSVDGISKVGKLTITDKEVDPTPNPEPQPTPNVQNGTVTMSTAAFYQNGYYRGRDYTTLTKSSYNNEFTVRYTLRSYDGYKGQVMFYIATNRQSQPIQSTIQYANVDIAKGGTVNVDVKFSMNALNGSMFVAREAYKNANNKWKSSKAEGTTFYLANSYYVNAPQVTNGSKHPSLGPVGYINEEDVNNLSYAIGVKADAENGTVVDGIDNVEATAELATIAPAMATDNVNITVAQDTNATIYAATGAAVMNIMLNAGNNNVNVSSLAPGMYLVKVANTTLRFVKK